MKRREFLGGMISLAVVTAVPFDPKVNGILPANPTDTLLEVGNPLFFRPNDILHVPRTGEAMIVNDVLSNGIKVLRAIGQSLARNLEDGDTIWIVGSATPEGELPSIRAPEPRDLEDDEFPDELLPTVDYIRRKNPKNLKPVTLEEKKALIESRLRNEGLEAIRKLPGEDIRKLKLEKI